MWRRFIRFITGKATPVPEMEYYRPEEVRSIVDQAEFSIHQYYRMVHLDRIYNDDVSMLLRQLQVSTEYYRPVKKIKRNLPDWW